MEKIEKFNVRLSQNQIFFLMDLLADRRVFIDRKIDKLKSVRAGSKLISYNEDLNKLIDSILDVL